MNVGLVYHLLKLLRNQWLTKEELEQIQQRKLEKIIKHAYEKVSYYHKLFDSLGIKPDDIRSKEDLQYMPVTSKTRIQGLPTEEIVAQGVNLSNCHHMRTSGSTGIPLEAMKTKKEYQLSNLVTIRSFLANGYRLWDKQGIIEVPRHARRYWFQYLGLLRHSWISTYDNLDSQIRQIRQARPGFIWGLSSCLRLIAEEIRKRNIEDISPRAVFTGGEVLDSRTREIIQTVFRSKVVDLYSCTECGNIAWECDRHEGYHINVDSLVVEILNNGKPAQPGEKGEVVVTSLDSYAMPLIRYCIKDIAVGEESLCSCGRGLPLLRSIEGKTNDRIVLSNDTIVTPSELPLRLKDIPGILQLRVIQKKIDQFILQLKIESNSAQENIIRKVRKEMTRILGQQSRIEIQIVDEIPRDPSGKLRSVISNVKRASDEGV